VAKYKNQHYVPQAFFRCFVSGKTISLYNIKSDKVIPNAPIKGQCSESYFYSKDERVEKIISQIENNAILIISEIIQKQNVIDLDDDKRLDLLCYITFQYCRTRQARNKRDALINLVFDQLKPTMYHDAQNENQKVDWEDIRDSKIVTSGEFGLLFSLQSGILLWDLQIAIIRNETNCDFIFSDQPVIFFNSIANDKQHGNHGFQSAGLQIFFPISPKLCLFLFDKKYYNVKTNARGLIYGRYRKDILRLNDLQLLHCDSNIYGGKVVSIQNARKRYTELCHHRSDKLAKSHMLRRYCKEQGRIGELWNFYETSTTYNLNKVNFFESKQSRIGDMVRDIEVVDLFKSLEKDVSEKIIPPSQLFSTMKEKYTFD
jgi:hypothetical protein